MSLTAKGAALSLSGPEWMMSVLTRFQLAAPPVRSSLATVSL